MPLINATLLTEADRVAMCSSLIRCGYQVGQRKVKVDGEKSCRYYVEYTAMPPLKKEEDPNNG